MDGLVGSLAGSLGGLLVGWLVSWLVRFALFRQSSLSKLEMGLLTNS